MIGDNTPLTKKMRLARVFGHRVIDTKVKRTGYLLWGSVYWHGCVKDDTVSDNLIIQDKLPNLPPIR